MKIAALAVFAVFVAVDAAPISGMFDTVSLSAADLTETIAGVKSAEVCLQ